ncbi:phage holin family protein [Ferviditalea candida]|uniref:Phage holin family protein n=1 Tax=Ferviditalea candida TaxID=3108399 RepID=A0ABU5ZGU4_9BACL|nr:phage holin family protein [Paenibacillaceae bacterium T2]
MEKWILRIVVTAISLLVADLMLSSVAIHGIAAAFWSALILGLVNAFVRPILIVLTLPITVLTFGLFLFIINAVTYALTAAIVPGFEVYGLSGALLGSLVTSIASWILYTLIEKGGN